MVSTAFAATARAERAAMATSTPTATPTSAYPPAIICGASVPGRCAARAGTATSATVSSPPTPAVSARTRRQAVVAIGVAGSRPAGPVRRRGGAAPGPPGESRSATTAPSTVAVDAIQVVQARLASQARSPTGSVVAGQVMMPTPYATPSCAAAAPAPTPIARAIDPPQPRVAMPGG